MLAAELTQASTSILWENHRILLLQASLLEHLARTEFCQSAVSPLLTLTRLRLMSQLSTLQEVNLLELRINQTMPIWAPKLLPPNLNPARFHTFLKILLPLILPAASWEKWLWLLQISELRTEFCNQVLKHSPLTFLPPQVPVSPASLI